MSVDYEFVFPSGSFDQAIYDACDIVDTVGDRQAVVEEKVVTIQGMFSLSSLKVHKFSLSFDHADKHYKVTVSNPDWVM